MGPDHPGAEPRESVKRRPHVRRRVRGMLESVESLPADPRVRAVAALLRVFEERRPLREFQWLEGLSGRDRGLAFQIVMGSLRHHALLTAVLDHCMPRPLPSRRHFIRSVLVTALFQARYLRIPERAAVFEAVRLVKESHEQGMAPFCNAVLRRALALDDAAVLQGVEDRVTRLALETSHPQWLVRRWCHRVGADVCRQWLLANNRPAPLTLRLHGDAATMVMARQRLFEVGARPCPATPEALFLDGTRGVEDLPGYASGAFAVADQGAQWIARLLAPRPGQRVLDACAAPGGKTAHLAHLAQMAGGDIHLTALEKNPSRLHRLRENLARLRVAGVEIIAGDATEAGLFAGYTFHRVLVDAPCTGTGIIRRHPEIKWLRGEEEPVLMQRQQCAILAASARQIVPDGVLVYATCSMEPEENEEVVREFLATHPDWSLDPIDPRVEGMPTEWIDAAGLFRTWPGLCDMDGFFAARLVRRFGKNAD
ncbi:MAG: 16S rRNA (cytosine(967)-C(5))-methyltransferase RsmB [Magnetococcales bacterium]|nr:16S rRNA (cytosine(967)-C(5))-methyltransferase RsmB [Magnetococcales bacterium]